MTSFVIDASLAVKWLPLFADEPLVAPAKRFLERSAIGEIDMLVPELFWPEVGSVLCKAVRKQACKPEEAKQALSVLEEQPLATFSSMPLVNASLDIALRYGRSIYDSLYVALAVASHSELVTADEKLANALGGYLPVKWLGSF
jgi:predicted nucleic acid-binding protein